jgi:hypothetical protein
MCVEVNFGHHSDDILDGRAFHFVAKSDSSAQSLKVQKCIGITKSWKQQIFNHIAMLFGS